MRTWQVEMAVVGAVLSANVLIGGGRPLEWVAALAVLLSFGHGQVGDRMAEKQAAMARPSVDCHRLSRWYFLGKEATWIAYFLATGARSALAGAALFLVYPAWRRYWRRTRPLSARPQHGHN